LGKPPRHLIERLVAFFATGDSIVANNVVLSLYKHINAPEARMYLSRQLYEEALHVQFYLTLLDNYVPDQEQRARAFAAIDTIPSIARRRNSVSAGSTRFAISSASKPPPTSASSC
jgi:ribonucleoside-diphosphate reductase beta chain